MPLKPLRPRLQAVERCFILNYMLIYNRLKGEKIWLNLQMQIFATADANVCNPTCKRLRPQSHAFICCPNDLLLTPSPDAWRHMDRLFWTQMRDGKRPEKSVLGDWEYRKVFFLNDFSAQNVSFVHFCSPDWTWKWVMSNCHFDRIKSAMPCLLSLLRVIPIRSSSGGRDRDNHRHLSPTRPYARMLRSSGVSSPRTAGREIYR